MLSIDALLSLADQFRAVAGIEQEKTLSSRMFDDSKKLAALRAGGEITVGRYNGAMAWLAEHWPDTAEMPCSLYAFAADKSTSREDAA